MFFKHHKRSKEEIQEFNKRQEEYDDRLRDEAQKQRFKNKMDKLKITTYTKRLVAIIIAVCLFDLQLSYVLAFMGRDQIAEELSSSICNTILGVAFVYIIRAYFDSRAEKKDKYINNDNIILDDVIKHKVSPVLEDIEFDNVPSIIEDIDRYKEDL